MDKELSDTIKIIGHINDRINILEDKVEVMINEIRRIRTNKEVQGISEERSGREQEKIRDRETFKEQREDKDSEEKERTDKKIPREGNE